MIWQHSVVHTARQRQADALAVLLMRTPGKLMSLVRRLRGYALPGRKNDPAAHRISLQVKYDESGAGR